MANKSNDFFPLRPESKPIIYAYSDPTYPGMLKVGYTTRTVEERMHEHYPTLRPGTAEPYKVELVDSAMYCDGGSFLDHDVHRVLEKKGFKAIKDRDDKKTEWFKCSIDDVQAAIVAVRNHTENVENRTQTFSMRPEQMRAVEKTSLYFESAKKEQPNKAAKFLWNAKMRFGKTFTSYQLAKKMGFSKVLILTFKPAVQSAWKDDLLQHLDFEGWQFICRPEYSGEPNINEQYEAADKSRPIVCFGSFQDFLGTNENGGIKAKNEWVHTTDWDLVIFDEYHFGAWRDSAKKLFENEDEEHIYDDEMSESDKANNAANAIDETWLPISTKYYLYLSGTPFRALSNGEFIEEQIFSWTYGDEQEAKEDWDNSNGENPYAALPRMVMLTYKIPDSIQSVAQGGEYDEFDLNEFFAAKGKEADAVFVHENYVQKWLDLIRGSYLETTVDELKLGAEKPPMPFSDTRLLNVLSHTLCFLPNVASCYAMANLLVQKQNVFYHDYKINVCAGTKAGIGVKALEAVNKIVGFRSLNNEIETIINKSESIKKTKTEKEEKMTLDEKKELSEEEKEIKSMRKQIQEKLIKFATRIPVFMYLSDYREYCLRDVIQELEPELFKRVTGLTVKDFNLLVGLNVFNETLMNDAVYKFKRYEDASLSYTGIDKHTGEGVGLYSTILSRDDYNSLAGNTGEKFAADAESHYFSSR